MRQTFTIAGSLALVSLFGYANAGYAQTVKSDAPAKPSQQATSIVVKASAAKDGTFDVVIIENGKTRKVTGLKPGPKGLIELPSGPNGEATLVLDPAAGPLTDVVLKAEGKPLIFPSGAAAAQAQTRDVSVKATSNGSGTFDVEITENGKTRKLTGVKSNPDGTLDIPELKDIAAVGTTISKQNKVIRVEGKPLIFPSGAAAAQAHSSNVSVKAIGNGSGTFDVEITENGRTRKLTGLKPGPKGKIEIQSDVAGHPPIVIDTTEGPHGNVSVRVEGKPLILPSGAAAAQAHSTNVSVKAIGNGSGTFDVEITENGKTRKLTGVKAMADGSLDNPELNGAAPAGATISKQIKVINVDSNHLGDALPTIIENTNDEDVNIIVNGVAVSGADGPSVKPGTSIVVTTDGNGPKVVKTQRVMVDQVPLNRVASGAPNSTQPFRVALTPHSNEKVSKEVLIEAKLVNGKKIVSAPKLVVLSGQTAKIQAGDVWLSLRATISPAGTIAVKGDAGSANSPKGPGFSVSGLASGGSFKYPNGNAGTWEIKASVSGASVAKPGGSMFIFKAAKP